MKKYFLIIVLLLVFSCKKSEEPAGLNFYFEKTQPINNSELAKFPNKFQGLFMNSDSVFLNIKDNIILKEYYNKFRFHKTKLDSIKDGFVLVGNQYISKLDKEVYVYKRIGDSIEFSNKRIDTFFIFTNTQKAKRFDGHLVLNYKDSIFWKIKLINLDKNILKINYINSDDDLKRIDSITKVKSTMIDSSSFIINPSRREFKNIINIKYLGEEVQYHKISNSKI